MRKTAPQNIIAIARRLIRDGKRDVALEKLRVAAEEGSIEAMIELAHAALDSGNKEESDRWIGHAESVLDADDMDGRIALNAAYSLGLGRGSREDQERKALKYLEEVAQAGNTAAQENIALHFLHGLNGAVRDERRFEFWIQQAVAAGSPRAVYIFAEHLFNQGRKIPAQLMHRLAAMRSKNKAVDDLFREIVKRSQK